MIRASLGLLTLLLFTGACSQLEQDRVAGIEGTGDTATSYGTVTAFGSVYVNGIHFNTDEASIFIDGNPASEQDLAIGAVVEVTGTYDVNTLQGKAQKITVDTLLEGPVSFVESSDWKFKTFDIMGQRVLVNFETRLDSLDADDIAPGKFVKINGFASPSGVIRPTRITASDTTSQNSEIQGYVSAVSTEQLTFNISNLQVDYASADFTNGSAADLRVHQVVEVRGELQADMRHLSAAEITFKRFASIKAASSRIEGIVYPAGTEDAVFVNDVLVQYSSADFTNGSVQQLKDGAKVIVEGSLENGLLMADKIHFKALLATEFEGKVQNLDAAEKTLVVLDSQFHTDEFTAYEDRSSSGDRYFKFEDLRLDDSLHVFAYQQGDIWVASRVIRVDDNDEDHPTFLAGKIDFIGYGNQFRVMGLMVDGSALDQQDQETIQIGKYVIVEGQPTSRFTFKAQSIIIKDPSECTMFDFGCFDNGGWPPPPPQHF